MRNIKLLLEYDGTSYQGWQSQKTGNTIQDILEDRIMSITGKYSKVIGASRTDAGVHALGQIAAFKTESVHDAGIIRKALNALLPQDIRVLEASDVDSSFHTRNAAKRKRYFYIIASQRKSSAFIYKYTWRVQQPLNIKSMKEASRVLVGKHNFSSFMGTGSSIKDPMREIYVLNIERFEKIDFMTAGLNGRFIKIRIEANGFLRHMVRNIVGTLVEIGRGRISAKRMCEILESHDRRLAGPTAPSNGLFLEKIIY